MTSQTLARIALFKDLTPLEIAALDRQCIWRRFDSGERILEQNDRTTSVYFVTQGETRVVLSEFGKTVVLGETRAGGHFGELAALDARPRSATVVARTHATLAIMPAGIFLHAIRDHPDVAVALLQQLAEWLRVLSTRLYEISTLKVESRLCAELLRLAKTRAGHDGHPVITPPPVHMDLASRIGARREAVTRTINRLTRQGVIIRRRGAWEVADASRLAALATPGGRGRDQDGAATAHGSSGSEHIHAAQPHAPGTPHQPSYDDD